MMKRIHLAILLILAFGLAPMAPVSTGWVCPDGTACVSDSQGYRCASDGCSEHVSTEGCCVDGEGSRCQHGDYPAAIAPVGAAAAVGAAGHCRFSISGPAELAAVRVAAATFQLPAPDGLIRREHLSLPPPPATRSGLTDPTPGHRPPRLNPTGPSRAPPTA
jgi:hypothetical protein